MKKETILDLWSKYVQIPKTIDDNLADVIAEDLVGWPAGTELKVIREWFDMQYKPWGGFKALPQLQPRKFQVETPSGILECYSKHEGKDYENDFPGVYIDLRYTDEQKSGDAIGDLVCCVEYDSCKNRLQIVPYADLTLDEPNLGLGLTDDNIIVVTGFDQDNEETQFAYFNREDFEELVTDVFGKGTSVHYRVQDDDPGFFEIDWIEKPDEGSTAGQQIDFDEMMDALSKHLGKKVCPLVVRHDFDPKPGKKRCPKCGCETFEVTAHVTQDWTVDANGEFLRCNNDCDMVTHFPDDEDMWTCTCCGYEAAGEEFNN